jgi:hypothetical protein
MIYEFFSFYNEFDMLELKLQEHDPYVDQFVITESNKTYNQIDKDYRLESQWLRYSKWHNKIKYLKFDANGLEAGWPTEKAQRAWPISHTDLQAEDIMVISDLDEFLTPRDWDNLMAKIDRGNTGILFEMQCYWCHANILHRSRQRALAAVSKKNYVNPEWHRRPQQVFGNKSDASAHTYLLQGGVHLTWMGDRETFEQKLMGSIEGYSWSQGRTLEEMWLEKNANSLFSHKAKFKKSKLEIVALEDNTMFTDSMKAFITKQHNWLL